MGDLGLPSPPAEVKVGVEPGWVIVSWLGGSGVLQNLCPLVALVKLNLDHRCFISKWFL